MLPGELHVHPLEVTNRAQIGAFAEVFVNTSWDVLIHNAGVRGNGLSWEQVHRINTQAPFEICEALMAPLLGSKQGKLAIMTSQLGARYGQLGRKMDFYSESKALLNDQFRQIEPLWRQRGVIATVIHPGWVRTDMGGASAPVTAQASAAGIRDVLERLTIAQHGQFLTWEGRQHPW